jgi:hypothetical protein
MSCVTNMVTEQNFQDVDLKSLTRSKSVLAEIGHRRSSVNCIIIDL